MNLVLMAAMTRNGHIIGKNGRLPWKYPEELQYFKETTMGYALIMGRKTFESFKKPLPNREHIVLSSQIKESSNHQVKFFTTPENILNYCAKLTHPVFVIGGASIYETFIPYVNKMYITFIEKDYDGDTYFPYIAWDAWDLVRETKKNELTMCLYERK